MATTVSELQVVVSADTKSAESSLSTFSSKLGSVGSTMALAFGTAAVAGVAALGAGLAAATGSAAGFEKQLSSIKAVSGSTAAEMEQMRALALQLGADTAFSATEAAQGIEELVKAGVSVGDVLGGGAAAAMNLAAAGAVSVKDAAELTSNALNAFGLAGKDAAMVADTIAGAANASAIDVGDFKFSLAAVGAVAKTAGVSFGDTSAAIALLGQAGIKGSDAGTSLKTMFMNLIPTTKSQIAAFDELGITTNGMNNKFIDSEGNVKSLAEVAGILKQSFEDFGATAEDKMKLLEAMFGSDAIRAAAVFTDQGAEGFNKMAEAMSKVTAEAVAQERLNNLSGSWEQLTGALETAAITLGSHLLPPLTQLVKMGDGMVSDLIPSLDAVGAAIGGALTQGITTAKDLFRQLKDAYLTVKQVFDEGWEPSAKIEPLANAAGIAATKVRDLAAAIQQAADKAGQMGAWDNFARGVSTLGKELEGIGKHLAEISGSLDRLNQVSGGAESKVNLLAGAVKVAGVAFELWALSIGQVHDTLLTFASITMDMIGLAGSVGKAWLALARGDMAEFDKAQKEGAESFISAWTKGADFSERSAARAKAAYQAVSGSATSEMATTASAVETNMSAANTAVAENSSGMQQFMEANVTSMAGSTQTGMAQVAGAVETGMGQAVAGVEAAAPQMASAAEAGATGAVAAVQGQSGAAQTAGTSVGENLGRGMEGGILAWVGRVAAAARQMVSAALSAGQAEAQIESPSKVTMYWGQMLDEGLIKGIESASPEVRRAMQDVIQGLTDYAPVAREIARVEREIKEIRERAQTDALFREQDMVTINSELLRLKRDLTDEERRILPWKHELADAEREIRDTINGSLADRQSLLGFDSQRKAIRLQTLDLEKQLVGLDRDSKRAEGIQKQIDKLRDQDRLLGIEAERIRLTNDIAADGARARALGLGEIVAGQERGNDAIKRAIEVLGAEQAAFTANENVIKNATENEIAYRQRLIAVFTAEGKPLQDRITAGLGLVTQLEAEGKISKELADKLRDVAKEAGMGAEATKGMGNAAATAAPQIDTAAQKAEEMAKQAAAIAKAAKDADEDVLGLAKSLGKLPSWFTPKGKGGDLIGFGGGKAMGGPVAAGTSYLVGERGPELFTPSRSGSIAPNHMLTGGGDTYVIDLRGATSYDGTRFEDMLVNALGRAHRGGRISKVTL